MLVGRVKSSHDAVDQNLHKEPRLPAARVYEQRTQRTAGAGNILDKKLSH